MIEKSKKVFCFGHAMKESLSVEASRDALVAGAVAAGAEVAGAWCVSDGGDGFLESWHRVYPDALRMETWVQNPIRKLAPAPWLWHGPSGTAIIEIAKTSGLSMIPEIERAIMESGTAGTGDVIAEAIIKGATSLIIGIGGSATCDGGVGMLRRLQDRLERGTMPFHFAKARSMVDPNLVNMARIRKHFERVSILVCSDVDNPLLGPRGSAACFGPQKGASAAQVDELDLLLQRFAGIVENQLGTVLRDKPGAGAAGGLGFAFMALGGELKPGIEVLLRAINIEEQLSKGGIILTSEGRFDSTSFHGKAPWHLAKKAGELGAEAVIFCGSVESAAAAEAARRGVCIHEIAADLNREEKMAGAAKHLQIACSEFLSHR